MATGSTALLARRSIRSRLGRTIAIATAMHCFDTLIE